MQRHDFFPNNNLIRQYRQVFSSRVGQMVLSHILYDLGVFLEISDNQDDVTLKNYGIRLLKILAGGEPNENSVEEFTKRLMKQPLPEETKEE